MPRLDPHKGLGVSLDPLRPALAQAEQTTAYTFAADTEVVAEFTSLLVGLIPGVGNAQAVDQAATGRDRITGQTIGPRMRVFIGATAVLPAVGGLRKVAKAAPEIEAAVRVLTENLPEASRVSKPLSEWLARHPDILEEATRLFHERPEWQGIDPEKSEVFYRNSEEVQAIRRKAGESGGHHPHGLALGGPEGQKLTPTGDTRTSVNKYHAEVTALQRKIIRIIKAELGIK